MTCVMGRPTQAPWPCAGFQAGYPLEFIEQRAALEFGWAVENELAKVNPAAGIKRLNSGDGFRAWTMEEVEQFETRHPIHKLLRERKRTKLSHRHRRLGK